MSSPNPRSELMDQVETMAADIKNLDAQVTDLNGKIKDVKSEREKISNQLLRVLEEAGVDTSIGLSSGGLVRVDTKAYPTVINMESLHRWASLNKIQLPAMQFNPTTLAAWVNEQMKNDEPLPPEDAVKLFWKSRIKVNK